MQDLSFLLKFQILKCLLLPNFQRTENRDRTSNTKPDSFRCSQTCQIWEQDLIQLNRSTTKRHSNTWKVLWALAYSCKFWYKVKWKKWWKSEKIRCHRSLQKRNCGPYSCNSAFSKKHKQENSYLKALILSWQFSPHGRTVLSKLLITYNTLRMERFILMNQVIIPTIEKGGSPGDRGSKKRLNFPLQREAYCSFHSLCADKAIHRKLYILRS